MASFEGIYRFVLIGFIIVFGLSAIMIISSFIPGVRSKMMKHQLNRLKDIEKMNMNFEKEMLEENKETLKDIAALNAEIKEDSIEKSAEAIARGLKKGK